MVTLTSYDWANVCLSGVSAEGHLSNDDVAQNAGDTCQSKINKDIHSWCSMDMQVSAKCYLHAQGPMLRYTCSHMTFCAVCILCGNRESVTWIAGC